MRHPRSRKGADSRAALIDSVRAHQRIATGHAGGLLQYARSGGVDFTLCKSLYRNNKAQLASSD